MATPMRSIRVDDETWERWQEAAKRQGYSVTDLIRDAVEDFIAHMTGVPKAASGVGTAAAAATKATKRPAAPKGMCEHRIKSGSFCRACGVVIA
jgi:predicted transcriptional regulator